MNFFKVIKTICFLLCILGSIHVVSYNDNENDCFTCEEYNRCAECYDKDDTVSVDKYPPYKEINNYSGRLSSKRIKDANYSDWSGDKPLGDYTR